MSEETVIWWSLCRAEEHLALLLGEPPPWLLSEAERRIFAGLRFPKRRKEWLLGRYAAKHLCRSLLAAGGRAVPPAAITVVPAPDGAPQVQLEGGAPLPVTLSISHRAGLALCALVEAPGAPLGADLELCEPRPPGFAGDFYTRAEQDGLPAEPGNPRWRAMAEIWSLKESALKALRIGLRADTRSVEVGPRGPPLDGWSESALHLALPELPDAPREATGWARWEGTHVLTLAWLGSGRPVARPVVDCPGVRSVGPDTLSSLWHSPSSRPPPGGRAGGSHEPRG